tara:strand:+ start:1163 stop:2581 length:1419 start_codon:yes stop_codon:yes gene_type:complete
MRNILDDLIGETLAPQDMLMPWNEGYDPEPGLAGEPGAGFRLNPQDPYNLTGGYVPKSGVEAQMLQEGYNLKSDEPIMNFLKTLGWGISPVTKDLTVPRMPGIFKTTPFTHELHGNVPAEIAGLFLTPGGKDDAVKKLTKHFGSGAGKKIASINKKVDKKVDKAVKDGLIKDTKKAKKELADDLTVKEIENIQVKELTKGKDKTIKQQGKEIEFLQDAADMDKMRTNFGARIGQTMRNAPNYTGLPFLNALSRYTNLRNLSFLNKSLTQRKRLAKQRGLPDKGFDDKVPALHMPFSKNAAKKYGKDYAPYTIHDFWNPVQKGNLAMYGLPLAAAGAGRQVADLGIEGLYDYSPAPWHLDMLSAPVEGAFRQFPLAWMDKGGTQRLEGYKSYLKGRDKRKKNVVSTKDNKKTTVDSTKTASSAFTPAIDLPKSVQDSLKIYEAFKEKWNPNQLDAFLNRNPEVYSYLRDNIGR